MDNIFRSDSVAMTEEYGRRLAGELKSGSVAGMREYRIQTGE